MFFCICINARISFTTVGFGQSSHNLDPGFAVNTLPVTLVFFTVQLYNNNQANVNWTTASENNLNHFEIEKSMDGVNFTKTASILAAGRTGGVTNYNFLDTINANGATLIFYRLHSFDADGKSYLSVPIF